MEGVKLMRVCFGGIELQIPEIWNVETGIYTEPDGRECAMIEISAEKGDPRSIVISYGPMPEGSDALLEASGTYEDIIGEIGPELGDDTVCEYDFLGTTGYGFEVPTENGMPCNFICTEIGSQTEQEIGIGCKLFTILTTAKSYDDINNLLDLVEQNISFE